MGEADAEKRLKKIEEDLSFCEKMLNKEARIDLAKRMLEDLLRETRGLSSVNLPRPIKARLSDIELKIRILYHRANALLSLQEEQGKYNSL